MKFIYSGDNVKFVNKLKLEITRSENDFRLNFKDCLNLAIGFCRLGHSGGRWFEAVLESHDNKTIITGEFVDVFLSSNGDSKAESKFMDLLITLMIDVIIYLVFAGAFYLVWKLIKLETLIIPFVAPIIVVISNRHRAKKANKKIDDNFIKFMVEKVGCEFKKS